METGSTGVAAVGGVVQAVSEHIISEITLAGGYAGIRVDESSNGRVIVSALEVVESGFGVVDIAPVSEGVMGAEGVCLCSGDDITGYPHRKERLPTCAALSWNDIGVRHTVALGPTPRATAACSM